MIHTRRYGAPGGLPTVLAHCFLGHSGSWKELMAEFGPSVDALALDMPGHGRSQMPDDPGDFHAMTSDVITGLVARPSLLIGHSFGAASMLRHALHHPQTVTGLVLIEPVYFGIAKGEPEFDPYVETERPMQQAVLAGDLNNAARHFLALNVGSPKFESLPSMAQALMAEQMRLVHATKAGLFDDSGNLQKPGLMAGFDCPVLLILGSETTPIFVATARRLAECLPRAEVAVIEGAGHMVPISHAKQTAARIQRWLAETGQIAQAASES